ncbi:MAG: dihydrodipicolinate synthase family protein, partial [Candidatus Binatia bacterium]
VSSLIVGVKEAAGSIDQVLNIVAACGDKLAILSGEDSLTFSMMTLGGKGVISTAANIVPKEMADLANLCLNKQYEKAAALQLKLLPLIRALFIETNPIPLKTALAWMGKCELELRLPLVTMAEGNAAKLKATLKDFGLL